MSRTFVLVHREARQRAQQAIAEAPDGFVCTIEAPVDDIGVRQRGFLHKAVLGQISEQARGPDGQRYAMPVWKELFRAQFLGSKWQANPRGPNFPPIEIRVSSEDLGVKGYSDYIDRVIAEAVTTWGVAFRFIAEDREAVRYVAPKRAKKSEAEHGLEMEEA